MRLEKDRTIAQLRSLVSHFEAEIWTLEDERRKLKMELRFRAKYQGRHALDMGLTIEQLLRVEQYVDRIRHGDCVADMEEGQFVEELLKRVRTAI